MNAPLTAPATPIVISQYEALASRIAIAKQDSETKVFDLTTRKGEKECRSYVFSLRTLRADIDRAREEAKSYALEYGRKVDAAAKDLKAQVDAVMEPHAKAIEAIDLIEKARIAAHDRAIARIVAMRTVELGTGSDGLASRLEYLKQLDTGTLEEFKAQADAELLTSIKALEQHHEATLKAEVEAAELARLRAEALASEEKSRQERIRQEAIAEERRRAEEVERKRIADEAAAKAIAEAKAKAEQDRKDREAREAVEAAQRKELEAKLATERAERQKVEAEQREAAARVRAIEAERLAKEASEREAAAAKAEQERRDADIARREQLAADMALREQEQRAALIDSIAAALRGKTATQVATMIVAGEFHPAVTIDWSKA